MPPTILMISAVSEYQYRVSQVLRLPEPLAIACAVLKVRMIFGGLSPRKLKLSAREPRSSSYVLRSAVLDRFRWVGHVSPGRWPVADREGAPPLEKVSQPSWRGPSVRAALGWYPRGNLSHVSAGTWPPRA